MGTPSPLPHARRVTRWSIAAAVVAVLLAAYWIALDHVATRVGESAESTFRSLPANDDARHRAD